MFLVESLFSLQPAQKYPIYIPDFPHIQSPHSIKLSCSDLVTLTTDCAVRPARAEQLSSQSCAGCHSGHTWGARSGVIELLASLTSGHADHCHSQNLVISKWQHNNIYILAADSFIQEVHKIGCNWSVTWKLQPVTWFKQHVRLYICDPTVFKVG